MPEVSDAACDLLVSLRHHLHLAEKRLPSKLFTPVWINLATQLDSFVFEKVRKKQKKYNMFRQIMWFIASALFSDSFFTVV